MLGAEMGRAFIESGQVDAVLSGTRPPIPLVLRAAVGDCIEVTLENRLPAGWSPVALHADGLAYDPADSGGVELGYEPQQSAAVGETRTYTFFAHPEYGTGAAMLRDGADLAHAGADGLYGAIAVAPEGATFDDAISWSTVVHLPDGRSWRDVVLFTHDADDAIGTHRMPYTQAVRGPVGLNYGRGDTGPLIEAYAGDPLQIHVLAPWSEQVQVFYLEGHRWPLEPAMDGTTHVAAVAIGGLESIDIIPDGGAGGEAALPGTYQFGDHREPYREAGLSGQLVVYDPDNPVDGIEPLVARAPDVTSAPPSTSTASTTVSTTGPAQPTNPATTTGGSGGVAVWIVIAGLAAAVVIGGFVWSTRRRRK
jgi:hypothetical protein